MGKQQNTNSGKDYYSELLDGPQERTIQVNGREKQTFFRRLTAGERIRVNQGVRFKTLGKGKTESTVDLSDFMKRQHLLVMYSNCRENGGRIFRSEQEVAEIDGAIFDELVKYSEEINKEDSNEGKGEGGSSDATPSSASS